MSNIQKALDLIGTFATGDAELAASLLDEGYIQHNLAYGTGRDAFVGSVEYLASAPVKTTVRNVRAFEDGDKVFLHWDNLANVAGPNPSGRTQTDGTTEVSELDKTEENRALIEAFLEDVMQGKRPEKTPEYFADDAYLQHNTGIADGLSGLGAALEALAADGIQMIYDRTHQVLAQGNFVLGVSEGTFGGKPTSYYDLWRVEDGKVAEHWDVMETIADPSDWQNENGKF